MASDGQPKNAVTVICIISAAALSTILPSQVAFTSLVSASAVLINASYGLIPLLRLMMTPNCFQSSYFRLGRFAKPFYLCAVLFNGLLFAVCISRHNLILRLVADKLYFTGADIPFLLSCHC